MPGGKASGEQAAQYADQQPDEGSAVTRRDTTSPERDQGGPDRSHEGNCLQELNVAMASLSNFDRMSVSGVLSLSPSSSLSLARG
jgi:hypothetical protein